MSQTDKNAGIPQRKSALGWLYDLLNARLVVAALLFFLVGSVSTLPFTGADRPDRTERRMEEIAVELRAIRVELEVQNRLDWEASPLERHETYADWRARLAHRSEGGVLAGR